MNDPTGQVNSVLTGDQYVGVETAHRRRNPLTGEWVLVSPHRERRPWQGRIEKTSSSATPTHDEGCYLCSGNDRVNGVTNPEYRGPYVFNNDFPALSADGDERGFPDDDLLQAESVKGEARVICYSERHDLPMPCLTTSGIRKVVDCWVSQHSELSKKYEWVAIFENKGVAMGCSNPHPHSQIWASNFIPTAVAREDRFQRDYQAQSGRNLLGDYVDREMQLSSRIVFSTEHWLCVVPFWATWPFETLLIPHAQIARISDMSAAQSDDLATSLKRLTVKYDNLFETEFPYSMGWHGAPCQKNNTSHWRLHAHFYPPLLRSATVKKFMVGYELLAEAQRDLTPETAASRLRDQSDVHYRGNGLEMRSVLKKTLE